MFNKLKKFLFIFIFLGLAGIVASCHSLKEENGLPNKEPLVIGLQAGYPPFEFVDESGKIVGFDIDVGQKIAQAMGRELVIKQMGFDALILALKQHKIDAIISGMSITEERLKEIAMVPYHGEGVNSLYLIFWDEIPLGISSEKDLKQLSNALVSVQSGTFQEGILHKYPYLKSKALENTLDLVVDIKYGKSTAALVEPDIGKQLVFNHPQIKMIELPLAKEDQVMGDGIGIAKDAHQMLEEIEKAVNILKQNGTLNDLHQKWFKGGK